MKAENCNIIFQKAIENYHLKDHVDTMLENPCDANTLDYIMYEKCWIDTVQWHLEDLIRIPDLNPKEALAIKQRIDKSNQNRTDMVEKIDDHYLSLYRSTSENATLMNTESPGWVVDRLSILCLKIFHMKEQVLRKDATKKHLQECEGKLNILNLQQHDLTNAFNQLLEDYKNGVKKMQVYRQMKMYNDANLNPELYRKKKD